MCLVFFLFYFLFCIIFFFGGGRGGGTCQCSILCVWGGGYTVDAAA